MATTAQGMAILNRRLDALQAFQERQTAGLNLSDRVWKYTDCFKQEIELGLSAGIEPGQPAADIARSLTQYLQHPDKLFRRVRDQYGNLQLSKAAAAFHPGRGVYRSSYKNARRLAATETNMAYRTADHQRWKAAPYVVGIRISLSHNHTCLDRNGVPQDFTDICDELAGDYPKTFHFTGWHPHCRCTATAILKTQDEIDEDTRRILNGEDPTDPDTSHNHIPHLPKNFTDWQDRNADRIASSPNPPAWATAKDQEQPKAQKDSEKATKKGKTATKNALANSNGEQDLLNMKITPSQEQIGQQQQIESLLGIKRGEPMNVMDADSGNANADKLRNNCQASAVAFFARMLGYNVKAAAYSFSENSATYKVGENTTLAFTKRDGSPLKEAKAWNYKRGRVSDRLMFEDYINKRTEQPGIYEIGLNEKGEGHVVIGAKKKGRKLRIIEATSSKYEELSFGELFERYSSIEITRIDDKLFNTDLLGGLVVAQ